MSIRRLNAACRRAARKGPQHRLAVQRRMFSTSTTAPITAAATIT